MGLKSQYHCCLQHAIDLNKQTNKTRKPEREALQNGDDQVMPPLQVQQEKERPESGERWKAGDNGNRRKSHCDIEKLGSQTERNLYSRPGSQR